MIKDSGNRREFSSGAVRDIQEGKGRCDLLPLDIIGEVLGDAVIACIAEYQVDGDIMHLKKAIDTFGRLNSCTAPQMLLEVSKHFEDGAKKYGEHNWEKGIPENCYIDSGIRHYLKWLNKETDEPHDRAFVWNMLCLMWTHNHITRFADE